MGARGYGQRGAARRRSARCSAYSCPRAGVDELCLPEARGLATQSLRAAVRRSSTRIRPARAVSGGTSLHVCGEVGRQDGPGKPSAIRCATRPARARTARRRRSRTSSTRGGGSVPPARRGCRPAERDRARITATSSAASTRSSRRQRASRTASQTAGPVRRKPRGVGLDQGVRAVLQQGRQRGRLQTGEVIGEGRRAHQMRTRCPGGGQRVPLLHAERLVELVEVADDAVAAELGRRVRVDRPAAAIASASRSLTARPAPSRGRTAAAPVRPSITGRLVAVERDPVGLVGDRQAAEVADVLADRQRAVDVLARAAAAGRSASYCSMSALVRASNSARSASVHQSLEVAVAVVLASPGRRSRGRSRGRSRRRSPP